MAQVDATGLVPSPARRRSRRLPWTGVAFVAPAALFLGIVLGFPVLYLLRHSLNRENFALPELGSRFIGLGNYARLLHTAEFWHSTGVTAVIVVSAVSTEFVLGLGIALLLQRALAGQRLLVALILVPSMMMPIAVGLVWRFMLDDGYGMVAYYLGLVHLTGPTGLVPGSILGSAHTALASVVVTDVWEWTPFMALILLAGLQSLPLEPFEAAAVDGATSWQEFWLITLPLLRRATIVALLIRFADAMRILDIVFVMTNGGPANATETAQLYSYKVGFQRFDIGLAFAQVVLVASATVVVCGLIFARVARDRTAT